PPRKGGQEHGTDPLGGSSLRRRRYPALVRLQRLGLRAGEGTLVHQSKSDRFDPRNPGHNRVLPGDGGFMRSLLALLVVLAVPLVSAARSTRWLATIQSEHTGDTATVTLQAGRARPIGATRGCEPTFSPVILVAARRARPDGVDSPSFGSTIRSPPPTRSCDGAVARATPISWGCHNPASTSGPFTGSTPASRVHRCSSPTLVRSRLMSGADEDDLPRRHTARESLLDGLSARHTATRASPTRTPRGA